MRLALLCDDAAVILWVDALADDPVHEITVAATLTDRASELLRGRSGIRLTAHWEDLTGTSGGDAVLVGGGGDATLEAIKQLANSGRTMLFLPSAGQGSTFIYELGLIRDDNRVPIYPAVWHRCDPALIRVRNEIRDGSLGKVMLLQFQRELPSADSSSLIRQSDVDAALLPDVDLLRWLVGDYNQVTSLQAGADEDRVLTQTVKLAGRDLPEATWEARAGNAGLCRLTLLTDRGSVTIERHPSLLEWGVCRSDGTRECGDPKAACREFLNQVAAGDQSPMEWPELVKAYETVDATHRSIKRRRTIELHFEPMSERAIFKSQMTAIGCSVLMATFVLVLVYLAIASVAPLPPGALVLLRALIFAPLGIFLVMQMLYPLTRPSESDV